MPKHTAAGNSAVENDIPQISMSENTPLLSKDDATTDALPKLQIFLLAFLSFASSLTFGCLFPYINQMVNQTGVERSKVGLYVGWIEGFFSLVAAALMISWAKASNRFGRKRTLLLCTAGSAVSTACFGFSRSLWVIFFWRGLQGAFAGSVVITRTMFAEFSNPSNQARAFSFYSFAGNASLFFGPSLGGLLCEPAERLPNSFGKIRLLREYPYALPTLTVAIIEVLAMVLCSIYLTEPKHKEKVDENKSIRDFLTKDSTIVLAVYVAFIFHGTAYTSLWPLWSFTDISHGGLSWNPPQIGLFSSATGGFQAIWILLIMPLLDHRYGTRLLTRICFAGRPLLYTVPIIVSTFARKGNHAAVLALVSFMSLFGSATSMGYTFVQLLLNQHAPPGGVATLNAVALSLVQIARTFAPGIVTSIEAIDTERNISNGYLAWLVMIAFGVFSFIGTASLPNRKPEPP